MASLIDAPRQQLGLAFESQTVPPPFFLSERGFVETGFQRVSNLS
jgi:hypothetical protein